MSDSKHLTGHCQCGQVSINFNTNMEKEALQARACDCDFCTSRGIAYLSVPSGLATIHSKQPLDAQTQGSEQAQFLTCRVCKTVIAASIRIDDSVIGAINGTLLDQFGELPTPQPASPKLLPADQKKQRWGKLWMPIKLS